MNDLQAFEALKKELVNDLTKNEQIRDKPYFYQHPKMWTRAEVAAEIEANTEFGIHMVSSMLMLALELMTRQNEKKIAEKVAED